MSSAEDAGRRAVADAALAMVSRPTTPPPPPPRSPQEAPSPTPAPERAELARARLLGPLKARHLDDLRRLAEGRATELDRRVIRSLAGAGLIRTRGLRYVGLTSYGAELLNERRLTPARWRVARWSADIVDLDGDVDRWALAAAVAIELDGPDATLIPAWPGRWRATGADRLDTVRRLVAGADYAAR